MSQINVNRIKDSNKGAPDFPSGVNVGGITSTVTLGVTNLNPTNVNVSGVVTATTFDGTLLSTGTPTLGLGVTINASGLNISGVATAGIVSATTLYGDGTNLTGIALTIAPLNYNPALNSQASHLTKASGIGLTFNQGVKAGSGNVTLSLANAGVAGTVVENFGVGNSVSYPTGDSILITPTADLSVGQNYHLSYPSGAFTNIGGDVSYVGTAYTFQARTYSYQLWSWGYNNKGGIGDNSNTNYSSPVQVPGTTWISVNDSSYERGDFSVGIKNDGTLWVWGDNEYGQLGQNQAEAQLGPISSPVQVPGTTWSQAARGAEYIVATKTDGTLWSWGSNQNGALGQNQSNVNYSSPVQIPGTTWSTTEDKICGGKYVVSAIKTDGTLWMWGENEFGLGDNTGYSTAAARSSPIQLPGTSWAHVGTQGRSTYSATKTDGTLWTWGGNYYGSLGHNQGPAQVANRSSPIQVPGTTWARVRSSSKTTLAVKTDGTLWTWGDNDKGQLGINLGQPSGYRSSPVQVPGTTWSTNLSAAFDGNTTLAIKTDNTLWAWGENQMGDLAQNDTVKRSSPVQIPGTTWYGVGGGEFSVAIKQV